MHEHMHKLSQTEWNKTGRQLMQKKPTDRNSFSRCHTLNHTAMEESDDSWNLTLITCHSKTCKISIHRNRLCHHGSIILNTISKIFKAHLLGGIDKTTSFNLRVKLAGNLHLYAKLYYLAKQHRKKPFHNKFSSEQLNAVPLFNNDMNMSRRYCIINHQAIDNSISTAPSYSMQQ